MEKKFAEISVKGRNLKVPAVNIDGRTIVIENRWIKKASIFDEHWQAEGVDDPKSMIAQLQAQSPRADIFTFAQKLPDITPKYHYLQDWDNVAAVRLTSFMDWWESLPQETRKNVRRSGRRGVAIRPIQFDDEFVRGIKAIYDESPVRQGRRFWHYGKDLERIKRENSSYMDRCDFIGAYLESELIGFIKVVHMGKVASIMQIISKNSHYDKRPANALLSSAIETSAKRGSAFFIYGQYVYGNNNDGPLTEFKRRNGFEQILIPRYYVPLTTWGKFCLHYKLHLGFRRLLPKPIESQLLKLRAMLLERSTAKQENAEKAEPLKEASSPTQ